ncbi:MAG: hypothetical protein KAU95_01290 [Candidatus Aenigmarchaeota archaeon]|nr:hypothetical protein [Candidatus Aenigmarchaeota archaeon]
MIQKNVILTNNHFEDAKSAAYAILNKLPDSLIYHAKEHTTKIVVPAAMAIAEKERFLLGDKILVGIAALFQV